MAKVRPFAALRYDWNSDDPASLIAPPYDVIDDAGREELLARSAHNAVRLILPADADDKDRYAVAADTLERWRADGTLIQDETPALYVYRQTFDVEGHPFMRTGFFAAVGLEAFDTGNIYPHERTLSAPKEDRFKLLCATRTNLSPVFGLVQDGDGKLSDVLERVPQGADLVFEDEGMRHELTILRDRELVNELIALSAPRRIFIADGHHRYETALRYRQECASDADDDDAPASVLMFCVPTSDPGLIVLPTHRIFTLSSELDLAAVKRALEGVAEVGPPVEGDDVANVLLRGLAAESALHAFAFLLNRGRMGCIVRWTAPPDDVTMVAGVCLDVLILHNGILPKLASGAPPVTYTHDLSETARQTAMDVRRLGALMRATPIDAVVRVASQRRRMPPKTTFFHPKIPTALVFRPLA